MERTWTKKETVCAGDRRNIAGLVSTVHRVGRGTVAVLTHTGSCTRTKGGKSEKTTGEDEKRETKKRRKVVVSRFVLGAG